MMTITDPTDAERFSHILQAQRAAYLRDGAPSLAARRSDLKNLEAALIARRTAHRGGDQHRLRKSLATRDRDDGSRGRRSGSRAMNCPRAFRAAATPPGSSRNSAWSTSCHNVAAGAHTFRWRYFKDGSGSSGSDAVRVDRITFP